MCEVTACFMCLPCPRVAALYPSSNPGIACTIMQVITANLLTASFVPSVFGRMTQETPNLAAATTCSYTETTAEAHDQQI